MLLIPIVICILQFPERAFQETAGNSGEHSPMVETAAECHERLQLPIPSLGLLTSERPTATRSSPRPPTPQPQPAPLFDPNPHDLLSPEPSVPGPTPSRQLHNPHLRRLQCDSQ